ncbi:hypothetical protein [Streptomyces griseorubiginosus]
MGDPDFPTDGNSGYDVDRYDVRIAYDPARPDHLTGDTTVTARALTDLGRFHLDLTGFDVSSVTVDGRTARSVEREGENELVITPARELRKGADFSVRVRYSGKPVGEGWHPMADGGVAISGEPHSATTWYPANDHPSDKATFRLTATVPDGWSAVGNGRPGRVTRDGTGRRTFRWYEDRPLTTYASMVAVGRFTVRSSNPDGTPVVNAYSPDALIDPDAEALQEDILGFLWPPGSARTRSPRPGPWCWPVRPVPARSTWRRRVVRRTTPDSSTSRWCTSWPTSGTATACPSRTGVTVCRRVRGHVRAVALVRAPGGRPRPRLLPGHG